MKIVFAVYLQNFLVGIFSSSKKVFRNSEFGFLLKGLEGLFYSFLVDLKFAITFFREQNYTYVYLSYTLMYSLHLDRF